VYRQGRRLKSEEGNVKGSEMLVCIGEERREFENFGGEILITISILLPKTLVTFRVSFWIKIWRYI
jgi:hypothetical protein